MTAPAVLVITMTPTELRALVRAEVDAALAAVPSPIVAPSPLLTKGELAAHLAVSPASIDRYVARGMVPCVTLGPDGPRRFRLTDVLASFAKERPVVTHEKRSAPKDPIAFAGVRLLSHGNRR